MSCISNSGTHEIDVDDLMMPSTRHEDDLSLLLENLHRQLFLGETSHVEEQFSARWIRIDKSRLRAGRKEPPDFPTDHIGTP